MRWIVLLLCWAVLSPAAVTVAQTEDLPITNLTTANEVLEHGHMAFERGDFRDAMKLYERVAQAGFEAPQVWTNAGTAAYRAGQTGRSVLYYQRALKLDPGYTAALKSFRFVTPATNQRDDTAANAVRRLFQAVPAYVWVLGAEAFFLIFCWSVMRLVSVASREKRGHWWAVFGWALALTILFGALGAVGHSLRERSNEAVILDDKTLVRSEPSPDSVAELELPAGTIIELTEESRRGHVRIRTGDGKSGFVSADKIETI